jgi:hypothetical protein
MATLATTDSNALRFRRWARTALVGTTLLGLLVLPGGTPGARAQGFEASTEAVSSLSFDTTAATRTGVQGNSSATLQTGAAFLSPRPFQITGTVKNLSKDVALGVGQTPVSMSLTLPPGLRFAMVPGSDPPAQEVSTKVLGTIGTEAEVKATWYVEATGEVYGALTYQIAVVAPPFGSRTVSRVVNVPATPLRTLQGGVWQLISFPFAFDPVRSNNGDPRTVINGITRPIDDPTTFFRWVPDPLSGTGQGRYQVVTKLEPGVAYFYRPNLNRTVFLNGAVPLAISGTQSYQYTIEAGWNMIGNPYVYEIPLNDVRVLPVENNPTLKLFTFGEAAQAGYVRSGVWFLNTGGTSYDAVQNFTDPLRPWLGYWIFANSRVTLLFTPPKQEDAAIIGTTPTRARGRGTF